MTEKDNLDNHLKKVNSINFELKKVIIGQEGLIKSLILAILSHGHVILEGVPGLAKTLTIQSLSKTLNLNFNRISFTPDLLPGDLIGGEIYNQKKAEFYTKKGPIFTNFLLADEINRASSKVQSALLEAMQEKAVTIGEETYKLKEPFFVLATQNPIEQEGTYSLPEAQLDRFMFKIIVDYPTENEEIEIMKNRSLANDININKVLSSKDLIEIQNFVSNNIYADDKIFNYIKDIIFATRFPKDKNLDFISKYITYGASPRASLSLLISSKANAFLDGRAYVVPDDVKEVSLEVLRHRIGLSFQGLGEDISSDSLILKILEKVIVP